MYLDLWSPLSSVFSWLNYPFKKTIFPKSNVASQMAQSTCQYGRCKRQGFDPWVRKILWRRVQQLTPEFLPENSTDTGAWWDTFHGVAKSWTQQHTHTWSQISLSILFPTFKTQTKKAIFCCLRWKKARDCEPGFHPGKAMSWSNAGDEPTRVSLAWRPALPSVWPVQTLQILQTETGHSTSLSSRKQEIITSCKGYVLLEKGFWHSALSIITKLALLFWTLCKQRLKPLRKQLFSTITWGSHCGQSSWSHKHASEDCSPGRTWAAPSWEDLGQKLTIEWFPNTRPSETEMVTILSHYIWDNLFMNTEDKGQIP